MFIRQQLNKLENSCCATTEVSCLQSTIVSSDLLCPKYTRTAYMLNILHWLPLQQRIMFRIGAMVWRCILGLAPAYLRDLCCPIPGTRGRSSLRSSEQGLLFVPFARTSTTQARAFSVVGPSVWNGLP